MSVLLLLGYLRGLGVAPAPAPVVAQGPLEVLLEDYRNLTGTYDKLVSIEMIEAVGAQYLDTYFSKVGRLLKPDGLALIQAITIEEHRYRPALQAVE